MSINSFNSLLDKAISVANVAGKKTEERVEASKQKIQEMPGIGDVAERTDLVLSPCQIGVHQT